MGIERGLTQARFDQVDKLGRGLRRGANARREGGVLVKPSNKKISSHIWQLLFGQVDAVTHEPDFLAGDSNLVI